MTNKITAKLLEQIIEGALLVSGKAITISDVKGYFGEDDIVPHTTDIRAAFQKLAKRYKSRGIELKEVASGYRFQVAEQVAPYVIKQWEEKPQKYSRALLETLALIAYRQPITRGDIEDIRGVSVSSNIVRTLLEREWVRVVGHKDVPGRPALYATTSKFLDYFNLKSLTELPELSEVRDLESINPEFDFGDDYQPPIASDSKDEGAEFDGESADLIPETEEPIDASIEEVSEADKEEIRLAKEAAQKEKELQQELAAREELKDIDRFNTAFEKMIRNPEAQKGSEASDEPQFQNRGLQNENLQGEELEGQESQGSDMPGWWLQAQQAETEAPSDELSVESSRSEGDLIKEYENEAAARDKALADKGESFKSRFAQWADKLEASVEELEQQELLADQESIDEEALEPPEFISVGDDEVNPEVDQQFGAEVDREEEAQEPIDNSAAESQLTERAFGQQISGDQMSEADIQALIQQKLAEQAAILNERPSEEDSEENN
ncbi:SMC-Scp complex subunit ScpB [Litoribrevibacter euphylliae]|uniref:SMC-Scp complex subunit ScpB n=1 Tax=Litoribrevibacter euphylliae TaxID=1834034 RepID=A0ABV7HL29_9GAMM